MLLLSATSLLTQVQANPNVSDEFKNQVVTIATQAISFSQAIIDSGINGNYINVPLVPAPVAPIVPVKTEPSTSAPITPIVSAQPQFTASPSYKISKIIPTIYVDKDDNDIPDMCDGWYCGINQKKQITYIVHFETNVPVSGTVLFFTGTYKDINLYEQAPDTCEFKNVKFIDCEYTNVFDNGTAYKIIGNIEDISTMRVKLN